MRILRFVLVMAIFLGLGSFLSSRSEALEAIDETRYVATRILAERGQVGPGEELWVAVEQNIHPGWHTYWKNPGDSGAAPRIEWTLPEGFEMAPLQWPAPHKLPYGPLLNYGYEGNVILLQKLKTPETLPAGPLTLGARVEILVCKDECIPEYDEHSLVLNGPEGAAENNAGYFELARSKLPAPVPWDIKFEGKDDSFVLEFTPPVSFFDAVRPETLEFIPEDWGVLSNSASPAVSIEGRRIIFVQLQGDRTLASLDAVRGVLAFEDKGGQRQAVSIAARPGSPTPAVVAQSPDVEKQEGVFGPPAPSVKITLGKALFFALLGGLVLNLMPCVFPVLSIKALSLVKIAGEHPSLAKLHGLSYTAGILLSFLGIAGILTALKALGGEIGWGFQLQSPAVVGALAYLLFIVGLNFAGVFNVGNFFANAGQKLTQGSGLGTSFFTGVLATLVATPCTAPFMAAAIGFAFTQPAAGTLAIFGMLGLGLALPYLALSFLPALQHILPRPGAWMETFRQALAFPMFASSAWLVWVLSQQIGPAGVLSVLMGMVALAFALWLLHLAPARGKWRVIIRVMAVVVFVLPLLFLGFLRGVPGGGPALMSEISEGAAISFGEAYTPEKLAQLKAGDEAVLVEMTAAWCITCKVNKAAALDIRATRELFSRYNVRYLVGDWTNRDASITRYLEQHGRVGVPLYVYYGPRDLETGMRPEAVTLPQILTPGIVKAAVAGSP